MFSLAMSAMLKNQSQNHRFYVLGGAAPLRTHTMKMRWRYRTALTSLLTPAVWDMPTHRVFHKSAHTALAVKACLLGGNSNTKCSMTFVNIAVAISALAGGAKKRFRTETRIRWCFRHFSRIFGCLSARGYWNGILGHFGSFPAMEKRPKMKKKHCT